jgi:hypothetical protein
VEENVRDNSSLFQSYQQTTFRVAEIQPAMDIRIGQPCPALDQLLVQHGVRSWAFITAWNPGSRKLDAAENRRRQAALQAEVKQRGYTVYCGAGVPDEVGWEPEESILVVGIDCEEAAKLGRQYGQAAIVVGERDTKAKLVFTN